MTKDAALDKAINMLTAIAEGKNFDAFAYLQSLNELKAARIAPIATDTISLSSEAFAKLRTIAGNTPEQDDDDAECAFCGKSIWRDTGMWRHDSPGSMPICNHIAMPAR
jgi:hypothetical protein